MKTLFTGSTGSIGSQMPKNCTPLYTRLEASVEEMIAELRSHMPISAVIHLAGLVSIEECEKNPARTQKLNVEGAIKWFEATSHLRISRFVFVSSAHVFAPPQKRAALTADSPVGPRTEYARSKLKAETELLKLAEKSETSLSIARVFSVLSKKMRPGFLLYNLEKRAESGDFSPIPGLDNVRDFLWANEICERLCTLAAATATPPISLICSGKATSIRELATEIFKQHGRDPSQLVAAPSRPGDIPYMVGTPT